MVQTWRNIRARLGLRYGADYIIYDVLLIWESVIFSINVSIHTLLNLS